MGKRPANIKVACAVDADVVRQISVSNPSSDRARYDCDVYHALKSVYRHVELVPITENLDVSLQKLEQFHPDVVFNLAHSGTEAESWFAAALEFSGIPYTGSTPLGIALSDDKVRSRHLLRMANLCVPKFVELPVNTRKTELNLSPPLLVKPARFGGSSFGIYEDSLVHTHQAALARARRLWSRFCVAAMCDEFVVGRELRVGIIEKAVGTFELAGVTEAVFPKSKRGWGFKSQAMRMNSHVRKAKGVHSVDATLTRRENRELKAIAREAMRVLDLRSYASLDIRQDDSGRFVIVDVNSNPGLAKWSRIWGRPSLAASVRKIVNLVLTR